MAAVIEVERVPDAQVDAELAEEWVRRVDDADLRGVGAYRYGEPAGPWTWGVVVGVAEFLREEPLEGEMRASVDRALRGVPGVSEVTEEDREVWIVAGQPSGEDLVRAVSEAVDQVADRAREHVASLPIWKGDE